MSCLHFSRNSKWGCLLFTELDNEKRFFKNNSFQDLLAAMKMLGLNPMEQEIIDLTNNIVRNGYIYFPEFCKEGVLNIL